MEYFIVYSQSIKKALTEERKIILQIIQTKKRMYEKFKQKTQTSVVNTQTSLQEEINQLKIQMEEDKVKLKRYTKIFNSPSLVKKKLIEELTDVREKMDGLFKKREE